MDTTEIIDKIKKDFLIQIKNLSDSVKQTRKNDWNSAIDNAITELTSNKTNVEDMETLDKKAYEMVKDRQKTLGEAIVKDDFVAFKDILRQHSDKRIGSIIANLSLVERNKYANFIYETNYWYKFDDNLKKLSSFLRELSNNISDLNRLKF